MNQIEHDPISRHAAAEEPAAIQARRRFLKTLGAGVAATTGYGLLNPPAARAESGFYLDEGGAVFNVKAPIFGDGVNGAYSDGSHPVETTAAIRNAISAARTAKGGVVYFPQGTYLINGMLEIVADPGNPGQFPANGISLVGAGTGATTIKASFTTGDIIYFNQVTSGRVRDLKIDSASARTSGAAINLYGKTAGAGAGMIASDHLVENVWLNNQFTGILISGQQFLSYVDRVYLTNLNTDGVGIDIYTLANGVPGQSQLISNVFITGGSTTPSLQPSAGIRVRSTGDFTLRSVSVTCCRNGLLIAPIGALVQAGFIEACLWDTCGERGVRISPSGGSTVQQLTFVDNWIASAGGLDNVNGEGQGFYVEGLYLDSISVLYSLIGCRIYDCWSHGFFCNGSAGACSVFLDNCDVSGNNRKRLEPPYNAVAAGISFKNTKYFAVRNCFTCGSWKPYQSVTQAYGIQADSGCNRYIITNNVSVSNTISQITEPGATNRVVANNVTT